MSRRAQPDETSEPQAQDRPTAEATPDAASIFAVAQDLLQGALDEVRGSASEPTEPAPTRPTGPTPRSPAPPTSTPTPASPADSWAAREPDPRVTPSGQTRSSAPIADATAGAAAAGAQAHPPAAATGPAGTPRESPARARRRARAAATAAAAAANPAEPNAELDGLTDALFEEPARDTRRRRRPAAAPAAGVATAAAMPPVAGLAPSPEPSDFPPFADDAFTLVAETPDLDGLFGPEPAGAPFAPEPRAPRPEPAEPDWLGGAAVVPLRTPMAEPRGDSGWNTRNKKVVAAVAVAAVILAALVIVLVPGGKSDKQAVRTAPGAQLTFDPVTTPEGAQVTRVWKLQGSKGSNFVGLVEFSNPKTTPMETSYTEVIPKAIAASVSDIRFDPQPTVVQADPVVRYNVTLPAGGSLTARYDVAVSPEGPNRSRLETWAKDLPTTTTTTTTTTAPTTAPAPTPTTAAPKTNTTAAPKTNTPATVAPTAPPAPPAPDTSPPTPDTSPPPPDTSPPPPDTIPPPPPSETGTIIIRLNSQGGTGTFTLSGPLGTVVLTTSGSPTGFAQTGYTVAPGVYPYTLEPTEGWTTIGVACEDRSGPPNSSASGSTATFNVSANETVVCTFRVKKA